MSVTMSSPGAAALPDGHAHALRRERAPLDLLTTEAVDAQVGDIEGGRQHHGLGRISCPTEFMANVN